MAEGAGVPDAGVVALPDGGDGATDFAALPCALGHELLELDREESMSRFRRFKSARSSAAVW